MESKRNMTAKIKILIAMLIWGSLGLFVRNINLPSGEIAFFRGIIGIFFLLAISLLLKIQISKKKLVNNGLLLSASGIALGANWIFLFEAYRHTTIAIATISYYLAPIFIVVLSSLILREKPTLIKGICIMAALIGLALVLGVFTTPLQAAGNKTGIIYGISAAAAYASLTLMNKFMKGLSSMEATIAQLGIASAVLLPYILFTRTSAAVSISGLTVLLLLILGVIHTGLAFWLFFSSVQHLKAQAVAVFCYLDPVTAIAVSALLLQETLNPVQAIGACLILGFAFISERYGNYDLLNRKKSIIQK